MRFHRPSFGRPTPAQLIAHRTGVMSPIMRQGPNRRALPRSFADLGAMDWASTISNVANDAAAIYSGKPPPPPVGGAPAASSAPAFPSPGAASPFANPLVIGGGALLLGILAWKMFSR